MPYVVLGVGLIVFVALVHRLRIVPATHGAYRQITGALAVMREANVPECEKERAVQRAAGRLVVAFVDILARSLAALAIPLVVFCAAIAAGLFTAGEAFAAAWDPAFLIASSAGAVVVWRYVR